MNTNPFHVGDRVLVVGVEDGLTEAVGREGAIVDCRSGRFYVVRFDERFTSRLHSVNWSTYVDPEKRCWIYCSKNLQLASLDFPSPEDIDALL